MSIRGGGEGGGSGGVVNGVQGARNQPDLNPYRAKGFGASVRLETPTMSEMRAKQGAIVAKFMTFFQRKCSLVIEMYEGAFYRQKPNWDRIAEFVYTDLCNTTDLRKGVQDVQFHPVKMLLFIKFSEEGWRDAVVDRLQSVEGVTWGEYGVRVKGYSLDAQVKFIRLLGVSPETSEDEIKETFLEVGIGEVIEIKKGWLDARRLPGVTNGTWALRVKICDQDKVIPSYIHRRDEGELWSLNFEGRIFCCWKCGSGNHIGDKCRDQTRTFEEIFNSSINDDNIGKPTWAAVVRSGHGEGDEQRQKIQDMEAKLKDENRRRDRERKELEDQKKIEVEEENRRKLLAETERQDALDKVKAYAKQVTNEHKEWPNDSDDTGDSVGDDDDSLVVRAAGVIGDTVGGSSELVSEASTRSRLVAMQHKEWLDERTILGENLNFTLNPELEMIFGPGATRLALQYEGNEQVENPVDEKGSESGAMELDEVNSEKSFVTSTPKKQRLKRKKRQRSEDRVSAASTSPSREPLVVSGFDLIALGSSFVTSASENSSNFVESGVKKLKYAGGGDSFVDGEGNSLYKGDVSTSGLGATVGTNSTRNDWKVISDFWANQAILEDKDDNSEEEEVVSEEEDINAEEEVDFSENVLPKSPDQPGG